MKTAASFGSGDDRTREVKTPLDRSKAPPAPEAVSSGSDQLVVVESPPAAASEAIASAAFLPPTTVRPGDLSIPSNQDSRADGSTNFQKTDHTRLHSLTSLLTRAMKSTGSFFVSAVRHEWYAAPISFLASFSSNFITAFSVVACAPWLARQMGGEGAPAYTLVISAATVVIGYGTYLAGYYPMMAYKEKIASRVANKPFNAKEFLSVVAVDFTLHLPNDLLTMTKAGAAQFAILASGTLDLFWSVLASQMLIDLVYSPKEAFYWSLAKTAAKKLNGETQNPANQDAIDLRGVAEHEERTKKAGNDYPD